MDPQLPDHAVLWMDGRPTTDAPIVKLLEALYAEDVSTITRSPPEFEETIADMPIFTVNHENALLREPFASRSNLSSFTRPCVMGIECMGRNPGLPGHMESAGGVILSEILTPLELEHFHATGALPPARRSCILCNRYNVTAGYLYSRKKKSFPQLAFLNQYLNSFGTVGEYATDCALPMAGDDGMWLGIIGKTCMLRLNLLRLEQDASSRSWVVNQSRMVMQDFRLGTVSRPMLGPFDAASTLSRFYLSSAAFKPIIHSIFGDASVLKDNAAKIVVDMPTPYLSLIPDTSRSFFNRLIVYRVNFLNELLDETGLIHGEAHRYALQNFIDSHIPLHLLYESSHKIVAFTPRAPPSGETLPDYTAVVMDAALGSGSANKRSILRTLFHRALPETAQLKSFWQATQKAMHDKESVNFLYEITITIILGNYLSAVDPPPYPIRVAIIRDFTLTRFKQMVLANPDSISLLFYCVRMYIDMVARACPPIQSFLAAMVDWSKQILRVNEALRVFRVNLPETNVVEYIFSKEALSALARSWKRLPKKRLVARERGDRSDAFRGIAHRAANRRGSDGFKRPRGLIYDIEAFNESLASKKARFYTPSPDLEVIIQNVHESLYEPRLFTLKLDGIDAAQFERVHDAAVAYDIIKSTRVIPLPRSITLQQMKATMRRFNSRTFDAGILSRVGSVIFCHNCNNFKNVIVTAADLKKKRNTKSSGYTKLAYNIQTEMNTCCDSDYCSEYELQTYNVLDKRGSGILAIRGAPPVLVSPCCGFLCTLDSLNISNSSWSCPNCAIAIEAHFAAQEPDLKACHFCSKLLRGRHADNIVRLLDKSGAEHMYGFCKSHFRPWARRKTGTISMQYLIDNIKNRKGSGLALPD